MADQAAEPCSILSGCCIFIWQRIDHDAYAHSALVAKVKALGAKPAARLSKEVTHVIFQRKLQSNLQERKAEDTDLRSLYGKVEPHVVVVSPLWLQHSEDNAARQLAVAAAIVELGWAAGWA
ncbi:hypothetical protein TSOC_004449 [Tetrabaena socialis]|uniref:BRCT domain-containing protein n=1 Tax=Tetrabaena socialis TaxID=47790 RepID=A0A2J8A8Z9_9CHLO|nr:hypothetical protein TSOC_004449 [Tetrabaena socialis]|eukprot:PNH08975.1 hypothetical protein TSOC_004449 [Tetrabaena socialis]